MQSTRRVESFFDPGSHLARRQPDVLEAEGDLAVDDVVDGLELGVLEDEANIARKLPRVRRDDVEPNDLRGARDAAPMKMRHQAVEDTQQRGFAPSGRTGNDSQALLDLEAHVAEGGLLPARVRVGEAA